VCTAAYFSSEFAGVELRAAFAQQSAGRVVPVLVEPVTLPALYAPLIHLDLTGLDEATAATRLRNRLAGGRPTSGAAVPQNGIRVDGQAGLLPRRSCPRLHPHLATASGDAP
jgi:hypothetical protein